MKIDRSLRLPATEYHLEQTAKDLGVLHHTVGGSAASSFRHWRDTPGSVATADLLERDGVVFEVFPPACWAVHLFRLDALPPGVSPALARATERRSHGIEVASEGALTIQNGEAWAFGTGTGKRLGRLADLVAAGKIVRYPAPWRGFQYFDAYDPQQVPALIQLVQLRSRQLGIPPVLHPGWADPDGVTVNDWKTFRGWVTHAMLRPDKTDTHLGVPYERLAAALAGDPWSEEDRLPEAGA